MYIIYTYLSCGTTVKVVNASFFTSTFITGLLCDFGSYKRTLKVSFLYNEKMFT